MSKTLAVGFSFPLLPVTKIIYVSKEVARKVEIVRVADSDAWTEIGVKLAEAPSGKPCALSTISPVNPV